MSRKQKPSDELLSDSFSYKEIENGILQASGATSYGQKAVCGIDEAVHKVVDTKSFSRSIYVEGATKFLISKLSDLQFFVGESMHDDGSTVFAYYMEGAADSTFIHLGYCLKEIKC